MDHESLQVRPLVLGPRVSERERGERREKVLTLNNKQVVHVSAIKGTGAFSHNSKHHVTFASLFLTERRSLTNIISEIFQRKILQILKTAL